MNRKQQVVCIYCVACWGLMLAGCVGLNPKSVKDENPFSPMLGKQFRLLVNSYVVDVPESKIHIISPDNAKYYGLPMPVDQSNIGKSFKYGNILSVIPKGSIFTITDIVRKKSLEYDIIMYYISLESPDIHNLNGYRLFSRDGNVPSIIPEFAEELIK